MQENGVRQLSESYVWGSIQKNETPSGVQVNTCPTIRCTICLPTAGAWDSLRLESRKRGEPHGRKSLRGLPVLSFPLSQVGGGRLPGSVRWILRAAPSAPPPQGRGGVPPAGSPPRKKSAPTGRARQTLKIQKGPSRRGRALLDSVTSCFPSNAEYPRRPFSGRSRSKSRAGRPDTA